MTSVSETVALFAELSLALTGFAGVAAAFSGRARSFSALERIRLLGIVGLSTSVLTSSLAFLLFSHSGSDEHDSIVRAALVGLLITLAIGIHATPRVLRTTRAEPFSSGSLVSYFALGLLALEMVIYGLVPSASFDAGVLVAAFITQLVHSIWMFWRLLTLTE
jgi:hypothetical protein